MLCYNYIVKETQERRGKNMLSLKTFDTLERERERERERESLTLVNKARVYLAYTKNTFQKINKKYLKIEML